MNETASGEWMQASQRPEEAVAAGERPARTGADLKNQCRRAFWTKYSGGNEDDLDGALKKCFSAASRAAAGRGCIPTNTPPGA
jgi:hypothetical protein